MENYNYYNAMYADVCDYINETINLEDYVNEYGQFDRDRLEEKLNDDCWIADSVTGNASGSYYCNAYKAREAIHGNEELLIDALECFGDDAESYKRALIDPEYADCTIRCYCLAEIVARVCDALEEVFETMETNGYYIEDVTADYIYNEIIKGA